MNGTEARQVRVSDDERERVAARLVEAHGEGRLTLTEFDERVRTAHGAVVRADLEPLLADLPSSSGGLAVDRERGRSAPPADGALAPVHHRSRRGVVPPVPFLPPVPFPFAGPCGGGSLRASVTAWATASLINLVIWVAVVAGTGTPVHPWWIWVAGPWGLALLAGTGLRRATRGHAGALPGR